MIVNGLNKKRKKKKEREKEIWKTLTREEIKEENPRNPRFY